MLVAGWSSGKTSLSVRLAHIAIANVSVSAHLSRQLPAITGRTKQQDIHIMPNLFTFSPLDHPCHSAPEPCSLESPGVWALEARWLIKALRLCNQLTKANGDPGQRNKESRIRSSLGSILSLLTLE